MIRVYPGSLIGRCLTQFTMHRRRVERENPIGSNADVEALQEQMVTSRGKPLTLFNIVAEPRNRFHKLIGCAGRHK